MPWGKKIWHGNMKANMIFPMGNNFSQGFNPNPIFGRHQGICTAKSLAWCKKCLQFNRSINRENEIGINDHFLNAQMAKIRHLDNSPIEQTNLANLNIVGNDHTNINISQMLEIFRNTTPHIGIFWTRCHTMGYRYAHHEKEFFDVEQGLFRSKYTEGIKAKILETYDGSTPDLTVCGCRVVQL